MLVVAACLTMACAPTTRYRVLSFFFDGVPPPPGMEIAEPMGPGESISPFRAALQAMPRAELPDVAQIVSVHAPYAERQCSECHGSVMTLDAIPRDAALCDRCHLEQRVEEGWNHGPINLGTCVPCHRPHNSIYPHLLEQPVPALCLWCHADEMQRPTEYHDVPNVDACLECHDPHKMS